MRRARTRGRASTDACRESAPRRRARPSRRVRRSSACARRARLQAQRIAAEIYLLAGRRAAGSGIRRGTRAADRPRPARERPGAVRERMRHRAIHAAAASMRLRSTAHDSRAALVRRRRSMRPSSPRSIGPRAAHLDEQWPSQIPGFAVLVARLAVHARSSACAVGIARRRHAVRSRASAWPCRSRVDHAAGRSPTSSSSLASTVTLARCRRCL